MSSNGVRVALVGAASLLGEELKQQLAAARFPSEAVTLLDFEDAAGVLTEYGDEARVLLEAAAESMLQHDLVCFCGDPDHARDHLAILREHDRLGLDCTGAWAVSEGVFLWIPGITAAPDLGEQRAIALPSAAGLVLGTTVAALGEMAPRAAFNLFVPASELGEPGLRELSQQSIAVLNLAGLEETVFGRQQAFDLFPCDEGHAAHAAGGLAAELERLSLPVPAINVVSAPVFHGFAVSLFVPEVGPAAVAGALRALGTSKRTTGAPNEKDEAAGVEPAGVAKETSEAAPVDSPVRAAGTAGIHASGVRADASGGTWAWLVVDNIHARAAAAVGAIHALLGPRPGDPAPTV